MTKTIDPPAGAAQGRLEAKPTGKPKKRLRNASTASLLVALGASYVTLTATSDTPHIAAGLAFVALTLPHLAFNRKWIRSTVRRGRAKTRRVRANRSIVGALAISWLVTAVTGLASWSDPDGFANSVHLVSGIAVGVLTVLHLLVRQPWATKRLFPAAEGVTRARTESAAS